jgi:glycosyltransferase involved in cell wall biosynthesis
MVEKKKILMISDHPLSTSGVGVQARWLIEGLLKTGEYKFMCFGAAVKHASYETVVVNDDWVIKPVDGFGDKDMLRMALVTQKPDAVLIFSDPRFFLWLFELEEELHQICPLSWWHVWDNLPWPEYNRVLYESTDVINCHSHLTYTMVKERFPEKTNFIPHALPKQLYRPLEPEVASAARKQFLPSDRSDHFIGIWVNRNAKRKRGNDVLESWKLFMDDLQANHGHQKATLIMHTDPLDDQGSNLLKTAEWLGVTQSVVFSKERVDFDKMALLYNMSDFCLNISSAEGFGLTTLEAMQCGKPIIALKTGGLTRQVVDHRDGTENGIALDVDVRSCVGSLLVPYIYEDYCTNRATADAIMKLYNLGPDARKALGEKARAYVLSEFNLEKTIKDWHETLSASIETWRATRNKVYSPWECMTL